MVQLLGSPVLAALKQNLVDDNVLAAPASWSSEVLNNPSIMMIGTTYDLEIVNGLAYLQQQGLIKDGDTIGHIYIDGEYGGNGLLGLEVLRRAARADHQGSQDHLDGQRPDQHRHRAAAATGSRPSC